MSALFQVPGAEGAAGHLPGGRDELSTEDFTSLMNDLEQRVFDVLPDDTVVYPGHGKDTNLGAERPHLGEWRARGW